MLQMIKDLQKMLADFILNQNKKDEYTNADICGCRKTNENQQTEIDTNSGGVFDIAELSDENNNSVFELAEMIADLEERVSALEEK